MNTTRILVLLLLASVPTFARNWYIAPSGVDRKSCGSLRMPCASIQYVDRNKVSPGDTVHVRPGKYVLISGSCITTKKSGKPGAPIQWVSDEKWGAKIDGQGGCMYVWHNTGDYVIISGFEVTGTQAMPGPTNNGGPVAILNEAGHTEITNNHVHHLRGHVVAAIDNAAYSKGFNNVHDNVIHDVEYDFYPRMQTGGGYGIYQATPGEVRNNLIYRTTGAAISTWHGGTNVKIYNNTIVDSPNAGIQIGTGDEGGAANASFEVANNIVVNAHRGIMIELGAPGSISPNTRFRNNLVYKNHLDWQYYDDNTGVNKSIQAAGFSVVGTVNADPKFVSPANDDYRIAADSPAIGRGVNMESESESGAVHRGSGTACDIGAFQHYGTSARQ